MTALGTHGGVSYSNSFFLDFIDIIIANLTDLTVYPLTTIVSYIHSVLIGCLYNGNLVTGPTAIAAGLLNIN